MRHTLFRIKFPHSFNSVNEQLLFSPLASALAPMARMWLSRRSSERRAEFTCKAFASAAAPSLPTPLFQRFMRYGARVDEHMQEWTSERGHEVWRFFI
jgi:hypothetical protein